MAPVGGKPPPSLSSLQAQLRKASPAAPTKAPAKPQQAPPAPAGPPKRPAPPAPAGPPKRPAEGSPIGEPAPKKPAVVGVPAAKKPIVKSAGATGASSPQPGLSAKSGSLSA